MECEDLTCKGCDYPRASWVQKLLDQYEEMKKKRMPEMMKFDLGVAEIQVMAHAKTNSNFYDLEPCKAPDCGSAPGTNPKKKGKKMSRYYDEYNDCYVEGVQSDTQQSRNYFTARIGSISSEKRFELMKTFGLTDDEAPNTLEALVKRIQDGKYVIPKEFAEKSLYDPIRYIKWRDPAVKEDQAGFDAALESFEKDADKARDAVMSQPFDKVAETVQALEAWNV